MWSEKASDLGKEKESKLQEAKDVWARSQAFTKQAKDAFATEKKVSADIPLHMGAAQAAAARAAYQANPAWQPPPPPAAR